EGMGEARKYLSDIEWTEDAYGVMPGADALLILTEWNEFRVLDLDHIRRELKEPLIVDLRNIYRPAEMAEAGFTYHSVGRETAAPKTTDGATG
ncbi:MAG: hypothetical protein JJ925_10785, partial [Parvibaculum sp.]